MTFNKMKNDELALILYGLRAVFIYDKEALRNKMIKALEDELAVRGLALPKL